ncbi:MAG: OmpA family protein [Ekhidna sp.]|nr:OmpA family protein [Ekhidna sp.]MBC6411073.1 OmpA family protein [Ekhidna sp.]
MRYFRFSTQLKDLEVKKSFGAPYNLDLSEKRAEEVYRNIINKGISEIRLKYKGFSASSPIFPNNSEINRKFNRRIEFRVMQAKH